MNDQQIKLAHILLVEDNEGDILLTLEAFEECKVKSEISVARNGKEALDFVFKRGAFADVKKPDLILLDINMPIFNGHEVLRQIKADAELKKIPVIMLTTSSNQNDIDMAYESYCNSYVKKPLEIRDFLSAVLKIEEFWLQLSTLSTE
ncbi:response regulator [soil metagenome]